MRLSDLQGKKITVMGLGILGGGVGIARFLAENGAQVLVTDIRPKEKLQESLQRLKGIENISYVLGEHREKDFIDCDMIVKNPGVSFNSPYLSLPQEKGIPIESDMSLFLKLKRPSVIGVTGTKGKTTTATLIFNFLKTKYECFLGGVAGGSPFDFFSQLTEKSIVILELSSWQLEVLARHSISPHGAVITNIYPDHLNRHKDLEEYIEAKKIIFAFQKNEDFLILNADDSIVNAFRSQAKGKVYSFSYRGIDQLIAVVSLEKISLNGKHNYMNILAALKVAELYDIDRTSIKNVLETFRGVAYRQEFIRRVDDISFYNDTTATIPEATIAALEAMQGFSVILIAGGLDKGLDYSILAQRIKDYNLSFVLLLPGDASEKIHHELKNSGYNEKRIENVQTMEEAVAIAFSKAKAGDRVLLSPSATSFNIFKNEIDRGEQFNSAVQKLRV